MDDASQIQGIAEPRFLSMNMNVQIHLVMKIEDPQKAAAGVERSGEEFNQVKQVSTQCWKGVENDFGHCSIQAAKASDS